jgi:WD40 repeat protein/serine/threonine protein kinase
MPADPRRIKELFVSALELRDSAARRAFLDGQCADDAELRHRVEALVQAHDAPASALERPLAEISPAQPDPASTMDAVTATEANGRVIDGRYKLLEEIGQGGMGTVWMAQQSEPVKRLVAVKLIKAGMDSRQVVARFEAERQALALMDHANIARVLDAGTTSAGQPYFVMDLVKGVPITKYCDEHHLTPRQRLELFIPVCQAVQHAHQKGIIHRDLKPSNVLVALYDGKPVPKVIDFGVAKAAGQSLTDKTLVTGFGAIVGTLEYMSPEQAEINQLDIDTRSDIYSLGVLLYELLTGSPPFSRKNLEKAGMLEMLRVIREQEPPKPSTKLSTADGLPTLAANRGTEPAKLTRLVRGELDWIVMKALEKDRNRRYETANGFAMDVQRYLADEPVQACPPSPWYRFRKFARRNKASLATALGVSLIIVFAGTGLAISETAKNAALAGQLTAEQQRADEEKRRGDAEEARAEAEKDRAEEQGKRADAEKKKADALEGWRQTAHYRTLSLALNEYRGNNLARANQMLDKSEEDLRHWEWHYIKRLCRSGLSVTPLKAPERWRRMNLSLDGRRAVVLSGAALLCDATTGEVVHQFTLKEHAAVGIAISPDGKWFATCGRDPEFRMSVHVWNALTGEEAGVLHFVTPWNGRTRVGISWGLRLGLVHSSLAGQALAPACGGMALPLQLGLDLQVAQIDEWYLQPGELMGVAFSPDSQLIAATDTRGRLQVWERATSQMLFRRDAHPMVHKAMNSIWYSWPVFSHDGKLVATSCSDDGTFKLWDAGTGDFVRSLWQGPLDKDEGFGRAVFSPKGKWLAAGGRLEGARNPEPSVRVWEMGPDRPRYVFRMTKGVTCLAFSADENLLAAGNQDGTLTVWNLTTGQEVGTYRGHEGSVIGVAFQADREVVSLDSSRTIRTWNVTHPPEGLKLRCLGCQHAAFSPDGRYLAAAAVSSSKKNWEGIVWDTATGQEVEGFGVPDARTFQVAYSPDGRFLASALKLGNVGSVRVWNVEAGKYDRRFPDEKQEGIGPCFTLAYSPDGKLLAAGGDRVVHVWDTATGVEKYRLTGHARSLTGLAFSGDSRRLVSATGGLAWEPALSDDNPLKLKGDDPKAPSDVKVWDMDTGKELFTRQWPNRPTSGLALSADGRTVAVCEAANVVRLYDVAKNKEMLALRGHTNTIQGVAFSPDGGRLVTSGWDRTIKLWDAKTGEEILTFHQILEGGGSVAFSPDGHKIVASSTRDDVLTVLDATPLKK